jgi:hypothetical protein
VDQNYHLIAAQQYVAPDTIIDCCGWGKDGTVYESSRRTAVKVHEFIDGFRREAAVYRRLTDEGVTHVYGVTLPRLINVSDDLLIIEMTTVRPPFVLDFAGSYLDVPPQFDAETWQMWREEREAEFGDMWPQAIRIFDELRQRYGIWHLDFSPRNVCLTSEAER